MIKILLMMALILTFIACSNDTVNSCRDGKLYQVSYDGNITIFTPTYDECEEIR